MAPHNAQFVENAKRVLDVMRFAAPAALRLVDLLSPSDIPSPDLAFQDQINFNANMTANDIEIWIRGIDLIHAATMVFSERYQNTDPDSFYVVMPSEPVVRLSLKNMQSFNCFSILFLKCVGVYTDL